MDAESGGPVVVEPGGPESASGGVLDAGELGQPPMHVAVDGGELPVRVAIPEVGTPAPQHARNLGLKGLQTSYRLDRGCSELRRRVNVRFAGDLCVELVSMPDNLRADRHATPGCFDEDRLVAGGVTRCGEDRHSVSDAFVTAQGATLLAWAQRPAGIGVGAVSLGCLELGRLRVEGCRGAEQSRVLPAMVEVKMAVDHRNDVMEPEARSPKPDSSTSAARLERLGW